MPTLLYNAFKTLLIYLPLSAIGVWRWSYWIVRRAAAATYKPEYDAWPDMVDKPSVSVVTPVYNEDPDVFEQALQSWIKNGATEIVAVIDKTNTHQILDFDKRYVPRKDVRCTLVVTPKPGKRAALCDGIVRAQGDIIALVDSDTIWGDAVLEKALPYFLNERVGGVTVAQRIQNPRTTSDMLFDILLWTRYKEEVPFLLVVGKAFNTLSGRTAFYRKKAILNPDYDNVHALRHELFLGTRGISGDDKRLTHLILQQGWLVQYALGATVLTPGLGNMKKFMKQRLRWTRNSWRADLRAVGSGWVWQHPALALFMIDRFMQPFFMLIGPVTCVIAVVAHDWLSVGILVAWWFFSRTVRLFGYFREKPKRLVYLPAYIVYTYVNAIIKIYALATIVEHSWATRWHKARLHKKSARKILTIGLGSLAVMLFLSSVYVFVMKIIDETGATIKTPIAVEPSEFNSSLSFVSDSPNIPNLPPNAVLPTEVKVYTVQPGETLSGISVKIGMSVDLIKKINSLTSVNKINPGQTLLYYVVSTSAISQGTTR